MPTRRKFIKDASVASLAFTAFSAASYSRILGANDRINVAVMGLGGRGQVLMEDFHRAGGTRVTDLCDTDVRRLDESNATLDKIGNGTARTHSDIRKMLENGEADLLINATPDHWHTPGALLGLQAGKHVYLEKPISHNPAEGELLVKSVAKHGKILQVGNQQRSAPESIGIDETHPRGRVGRHLSHLHLVRETTVAPSVTAP